MAWARLPVNREVASAWLSQRWQGLSNVFKAMLCLWTSVTLFTWPSPRAGQVLKCGRFFIFGGSRWWLVGSVHVTFSRHLGKAYTKYCPLSSPKRAECLCVCFHCLSGVVFVSLKHSCRIRTYTPDAGDHGELFWSGFWLRWFSLLCTHWAQVYWHNARPVVSLIPPQASFLSQPSSISDDVSRHDLTSRCVI